MAKPASTRKIGRQIVRFTFKAVSMFGKDCFMLHGSAIAKGGKANIFLGRSNAGKTTVSLFAAHHGYEILADELCVVDKKNLKVAPIQRGRININPYTVKFFRESGLMKDRKYASLNAVMNKTEAIRACDILASGMKFSDKAYPIDKIYLFQTDNAPIGDGIHELFPFYRLQSPGEREKDIRSLFRVLERRGFKVIPTLDLGNSEKRKQTHQRLRRLLK